MISWRRRSEPGIDLGDLNCENKKYSLFSQYSQTKLANVMFALELNRRERLFRLFPVGQKQVGENNDVEGKQEINTTKTAGVRQSCMDGPHNDDDIGDSEVGNMAPSSGGMPPNTNVVDEDRNAIVSESPPSFPRVVSYCVHPGLVRTDFV